MTEPMITYPKCQTEIKLTESLAAPIVESARREYEQCLAQKDADIAKRETLLREREKEIAQAKEGNPLTFHCWHSIPFIICLPSQQYFIHLMQYDFYKIWWISENVCYCMREFLNFSPPMTSFVFFQAQRDYIIVRMLRKSPLPPISQIVVNSNAIQRNQSELPEFFCVVTYFVVIYFGHP